MDILQWNLSLLIIGLVIYAILNAVCVANNSVQRGKQKNVNTIYGLPRHSRLWSPRIKRLSRLSKKRSWKKNSGMPYVGE